MPGKIEIICGPMFAGKTTELIRRIEVFNKGGKKVTSFKPAKDNRYDDEQIATHDGKTSQAFPINSLKELLQKLPSDTEIITIDEIHFFPDDPMEVVRTCSGLADKGHHLIIAGVDQDFRAEPFHPICELLAIAEKVTKLKSACTCCGDKAHQSQRLINGEPAAYDSPTIQVGADELYEPRCRKCHQIIKK